MKVYFIQKLWVKQSPQVLVLRKNINSCDIRSPKICF